MFEPYIDICGIIDNELADRVCRQIKEYSKYSEPITLFIDTEGGYTSCLQQIVNAIIDCGVPIYARVIGKAYSAGFDLMLFCEKRYARVGSTFLFHWAVYDDQVASSVSMSFGEKSFAPEEEFDTEVFTILAGILNKSIDDIREMAREERLWTAMQALHCGIIDFVLID